MQMVAITQPLVPWAKLQMFPEEKKKTISVTFSFTPSVSTSVSQEKQLQCHNSFVNSSIQIKGAWRLPVWQII